MKNLKNIFIILLTFNIAFSNSLNSSGLGIAQIINYSDKQIFIDNKLIKLNKNCVGKFKSDLILPYNSCAQTAKYLLVNNSQLNSNTFKFPNNSLKVRVGNSEEFAMWYNEQGVYCLSKDNNYSLKKIFAFSQNLSNAEKLKLISIIRLIITIQSCENSIKHDCRFKLSIV